MVALECTIVYKNFTIQRAVLTPDVLPTTRAGRRAYLNDAIRALTTR